MNLVEITEARNVYTKIVFQIYSLIFVEVYGKSVLIVVRY
jgi:hypothetical protein